MAESTWKGRRIGPYQVRGLLGKGGMGYVFLAHDHGLDRPAALKVLREAPAGDAGWADRFLQEARAAAGLSHPNIVKVYAAGEEKGIHYIAMEYVEGAALGAYVHHRGTVAPRQALHVLRAAAAGLAEAHRHGIIHRDIKPHNILVDRSGQVKVADFGLAQVRQAEEDREESEDKPLMGTPHYMAPELIEGGPATPQTDLYALGVTLFELLTGTLPFTGKSSLAVMYQATRNPFPDWAAHAPSAPPVLWEIGRRLTEREPGKRYTSAEVLYQDVRSALKGRSLPLTHAARPRAKPAAAGPVSTLEPMGASAANRPPARQTPRYWRRWALLLSFALAAAAGMAAGSCWREAPAHHGKDDVPYTGTSQNSER